MSNKNIKLIFLALGALMLVLLQSNIFQNALGFINLLPIPLDYLGDIVFFISNMLSFIGSIIFIIASVKLISNNINNKNS